MKVSHLQKSLNVLVVSALVTSACSPISSLLTQTPTQEPIPTIAPTPTLTYEQNLLSRLQQIKENYRLNYDEWSQKNETSIEERMAVLDTFSSVSSITQEEFIQNYFRKINTTEILNMISRDFNNICNDYTYLVIERRYPLIILKNSQQGEGNFISENGDVHMNCSTPIESMRFITSQISEYTSQRVREEPIAEAINWSWIISSFNDLVGENMQDYSFEFEESVMEFQIYRLSDGVVIDSILATDQNLIQLRTELSALFNSFPEYGYHERGTIVGLTFQSYIYQSETQLQGKPNSLMLIVTTDLINSIITESHELTHTYLNRGATRLIDGKVEESIAHIVSWEITREVMSKHYGTEVVSTPTFEKYFNPDGSWKPYALSENNEADPIRDTMITLRNHFGSLAEFLNIAKEIDTPERLYETINDYLGN
jgi:hypothetical protein